MTPDFVLEYLTDLGRQWKGHGVAIELGSWLGATAAALLQGLVEAGYDRPFYCFDKWWANGEEVKKAQYQGLDLKYEQNILPHFLANVKPVYDNIYPIQGKIQHKIYLYPMRIQQPIEVCLFDAPKKEPVFTIAMRALQPYFIPGVTVLGLLDYYFYKRQGKEKKEIYKAPVRFMEQYGRYFTKIKEWPGLTSVVMFRYDKEFKIQ